MAVDSTNRDRQADGAIETRHLLSACRHSHDRLARLVEPLDEDGLDTPSYSSDWTIADVLSHLGSQAEIFGLFLEAALTGGKPPAPDEFGPIWDSWNARPPVAIRSDSLAANDRLLRRIDGLDDDRLASLHVEMFGADRDVAGLLRMRLSEHAVHTWDVAVALVPEAEVAAEAVEVIIDGLPNLVARVGRPATHPTIAAVTTRRPERHFVLDTGGVELRPGSAGASASVDLPAEAMVRLVYGRLEDTGLPRDEVRTDGVSLDELRSVFTGV